MGLKTKINFNKKVVVIRRRGKIVWTNAVGERTQQSLLCLKKPVGIAKLKAHK